jgi:hypothetical protein
MKILSDDEIREEINKAGGYEAYRKSTLDFDKPVEKAQPIQKTVGEAFLESCEVLAKVRDQTIAEYFAKNRADYERYRTLSSVRA